MSYTLLPPPQSPPAAQRARCPGFQPHDDREGREERGRLRLPRLRGRGGAARQGAGAQEHHPGAERHRLARRRQDRLGAHQRPRYALHVPRCRRHHGAGRLQARHHPHPEGRRPGRRLHGRVHRQPDRGGEGLHEQGRDRSADRDAARHGQRRSHRRRPEPARGDALRRRRLCRLQQGAHRRHRRPEPRLPRRSVALRAVAHDGRLPRLRPAPDRRSRSATSPIPMATPRAPSAQRHSASRASGRSIPRRSSSPTPCSRRRPRRSSAPSASSWR